jgi:hypothetical protein
LASAAHSRGMAIGIKNGAGMVKDLVSDFDFAITEDAFYYDFANDMIPFVNAGKPVLAAEYTDMKGNFNAFCVKSKALRFSTILKNRALEAFVKFCPN